MNLTMNERKYAALIAKCLTTKLVKPCGNCLLLSQTIPVNPKAAQSALYNLQLKFVQPLWTCPKCPQRVRSTATGQCRYNGWLNQECKVLLQGEMYTSCSLTTNIRPNNVWIWGVPDELKDGQMITGVNFQLKKYSRLTLKKMC